MSKFKSERQKMMSRAVLKFTGKDLTKWGIEEYKKQLKQVQGAKFQGNTEYSFRETKILFKYYGVGTKYLKGLADRTNELEYELRKLHDKKAENLMKVFIKTGFLKVRGGGYSQAEMSKFLAEKDAIVKFAEKTRAVSKAAGEAMKVFGIAEKAWDTFESLYEIKTHMAISKDNERLKVSAANLRIEMQNAFNGMQSVMKLVKSINGASPPGVQEYIGFIIETFKASEKGINIAKKHAEETEKKLQHISKLEELYKNPASVKRLNNKADAYHSLPLTLPQFGEKVFGKR